MSCSRVGKGSPDGVSVGVSLGLGSCGANVTASCTQTAPSDESTHDGSADAQGPSVGYGRTPNEVSQHGVDGETEQVADGVDGSADPDGSDDAVSDGASVGSAALALSHVDPPATRARPSATADAASTSRTAVRRRSCPAASAARRSARARPPRSRLTGPPRRPAPSTAVDAPARRAPGDEVHPQRWPEARTRFPAGSSLPRFTPASGGCFSGWTRMPRGCNPGAPDRMLSAERAGSSPSSGRMRSPRPGGSYCAAASFVAAANSLDSASAFRRNAE